MRDRDHIDHDLFDRFLRSGVIDRNTEEFLFDERRDEFDVEELLRRSGQTS